MLVSRRTGGTLFTLPPDATSQIIPRVNSSLAMKKFLSEVVVSPERQVLGPPFEYGLQWCTHHAVP